MCGLGRVKKGEIDGHDSTGDDPEQLRQWLYKVAEESGIERSIISQFEPLSRYGLTSMQAVTITGDLEAVLGRGSRRHSCWKTHH